MACKLILPNGSVLIRLTLWVPVTMYIHRFVCMYVCMTVCMYGIKLPTKVTNLFFIIMTIHCDKKKPTTTTTEKKKLKETEQNFTKFVTN